MADQLTLEYRHLSLVPAEIDWQKPVVTVPPGLEGLYSSYARPMVLVKFTGPSGGEVFEWATLDTGSDSTSLPPRLMAQLGITPSMCTPELACVSGGVSPCPKFTDGIEMTVAGTWRLRIEPHFVSAFPFVLLGEGDFFEAFKVALDHRGRTFTLEAHADVERLPDRAAEEMEKVRRALAEVAA